MLLDYAPDDLDVRVAELLVATADGADEALDARIHEVLRLLRQRLRMDVVFVSSFDDGRRTFLHVDHAGEPLLRAGDSDPLEESWCQRVVDGRIPELIRDARPLVAAGAMPAPAFPIGAHLSTPVPAADGRAMGTLCCFSFEPQDDVREADLKRLKYAAQLLASRLGKKAQQPAPAPALELAPEAPRHGLPRNF